MPRTLAEAAAAGGGGAPPPPLVTVTSFVNPAADYLYMCMGDATMTSIESRFLRADGSLAFRVESKDNFFSASKRVLDAQGQVVFSCKKSFLSRAKWTVCRGASTDGPVVAKTRTIAGLAKIGLEIVLPSRGSKPTFMAMPNFSDTSRMLMWQENGKGKEETPLCEAAFGNTVVLGMVSALVQNWTYHVALAPGADAALVCALLVIYTDLLEWNTAGAAFGMN